MKVLFGEVSDINFEKKEIVFQNNTESYDYLILATGAKTGYFGNTQWQNKTLGLKT